jgi:hypothetical protein
VVRSFHVRLIVADFDGCFRFYLPEDEWSEHLGDEMSRFGAS